MKAITIAERLSSQLPLYTTAFTENLAIDSITVAGSVATVTTTTNNKLVNGQGVGITGVLAPVEIDTGTFLRTDTIAEFETLQDHDLTLSNRDIANGGKTITISGATEPEFNGVFQLAQI